MNRKIFISVLSTIIIFGLISVIVFTFDKSTEKSGNFSGEVDVGGYSMYINVEGQRQNGLPTVVFENGLGCSYSDWDGVVLEIAKKTRIVTYDRIAIEQLDRKKVDYTAAGTAKRLHTLLKKAGVTGPIVLAVHSFGGIYAREYQYLYPDQVKGIVFVDSSTEHQEKYLFPESDPESTMNDKLTVELSVNDMINSYNQIDTAQATDPLRNLPIVVLSRGNYTDLEPGFEVRWADRQAYIASLSSRSIHKTDTNSGHFIQRENPPFIIDGINELLNQLKTN